MENYRCTRAEASFVFTDSDKNSMGVVAIAAAIAGLSGPAIATAVNAASNEEEADYVEFELNGKTVKGWVWRSPFKEGDAVEVAAEWRGDHYEAAGIARPVDRIIAMHPHCSRGKSRHIQNSVKWWFLGTTLFFIFVALLTLVSEGFDEFIPFLVGVHEDGGNFIYGAVFIFFGLMTFSLTRKWMPFARLADKVFKTLNLPNPENIDLVKSSKTKHKPDDPNEFGVFYFRY